MSFVDNFNNFYEYNKDVMLNLNVTQAWAMFRVR